MDKVHVRTDHVTLIISKQNPKTMRIINMRLIFNLLKLCSVFVIYLSMVVH
jgi:hypothetical protein